MEEEEPEARNIFAPILISELTMAPFRSQLGIGLALLLVAACCAPGAHATARGLLQDSDCDACPQELIVFGDSLSVSCRASWAMERQSRKERERVQRVRGVAAGRAGVWAEPPCLPSACMFTLLPQRRTLACPMASGLMP